MRSATGIDDYLGAGRDACLVELELCAARHGPGAEYHRGTGAELGGAAAHELALDYRVVEVFDHAAFQYLAEWVDANRERLAHVTLWSH